MKILRSLFLVLVASLAALSQADTEFEEGIPLALVRALLGGSASGEPRIYSDILSDFPNFQIPADFSVLGSVDGGYYQSIYLQTRLTRAEAQAALIAAFADEGFYELSLERPGGRNSGFIDPRMSMATPMLLCHDDFDRISMNVSERESYNIVSLGTSQLGRQQQSCEELIAMQATRQSSMNSQTGVQQYLPQLEVPRDQSSRRSNSGGSGMSGSGSEMQVRYQLIIDWEIDDVYQHFADQLLAQDWKLDSEALGDSTANGIWLKSPAPDVDLSGTLSILSSDDSSYQLTFTLRSLGEQGGRSRGFFSPTPLRN